MDHRSEEKHKDYFTSEHLSKFNESSEIIDADATIESEKSKISHSKEDIISVSPSQTTKLLQNLNLEAGKEIPASKHKFWGSQPIILKSNLEYSYSNSPVKEPFGTTRAEPLTLSGTFEWSNIDLDNHDQIMELYDLLHENYVEDDDHMFRFAYTNEFLYWALSPPGWKPEYRCGVRVKSNGKLVAFISAVPAKMCIDEKCIDIVEINFLCVHEKLRNKRVAPVLIREITRRVNVNGIYQAVFTSGAKLPNRPVSVCRYWHRSLNPKKLIEIEFSYLTKNMTLQRSLKLYKLPNKTLTNGLRKFKLSDAKYVCEGLNKFLSQFKLYPLFDENEIIHWLTPKDGVIYTWVVQPLPNEPITDMISFYSIPSSIMRHPKHKILYTAYLFYYFVTVTPCLQLFYDALILANLNNFDVFNSLDIMEHKTTLEELKFGMGDGNLEYYLYNWCTNDIAPSNVGLVLQ